MVDSSLLLQITTTDLLYSASLFQYDTSSQRVHIPSRAAAHPAASRGHYSHSSDADKDHTIGRDVELLHHLGRGNS
jgi:hypothetical protein